MKLNRGKSKFVAYSLSALGNKGKVDVLKNILLGRQNIYVLISWSVTIMSVMHQKASIFDAVA